MTEETVRKPELKWFRENFEPVRPEAWADAPEALMVCLTCGAAVFRYAAASHLNWHLEAS